jgi:hypothetical protein
LLLATAAIGCSKPPPANQTVTLSWSAPTKNTDGSPIGHLAGYRIYVGRDSKNLSLRGGITGAASTVYVVSGLDSGTYFFAVSAYTDSGAESAHSSVASKTL